MKGSVSIFTCKQKKKKVTKRVVPGEQGFQKEKSSAELGQNRQEDQKLGQQFQ